MSVLEKRRMLAHVRKEHLRSIRDKFDELLVVPQMMKPDHVEQLLKALTAYILRGGYDDYTE